MTAPNPTFRILPCLDSPELAAQRKRELRLPRNRAAALGRSAVEAIRQGFYSDEAGARVAWREAVEAARAAKRSLHPDDPLPRRDHAPFPETNLQVTNETTLGAAERLAARGLTPLALNFASGVHPGGGFLSGALAQEEVLCRSSALYATLEGDPMYAAHALRPRPDSSDWAIYSPDVPVFRRDDGTPLDAPWPLTFLTCAAPYAPAIGQPEAGDLLQQRIRRVIAIARAFGHPALVLGAWGCGAFANDPARTARDFRQSLETDFSGAFGEIAFAIADWSPDRRFLGPFREAFAAANA
jgi:uncharacterized protein (TIGR02452 family)